MIDSMKFHHIGVAVKDIEKTAAVYVQGGYNQSAITFDAVQNVNICWLTKEGMPTVELLAPVDESSPVCKTLEKNGVTPYHTCYIVEDIETAVAELRKMKYVPISILFFSYFSIHLIYTSSTNFILNQAFKNDLVLIVMLSQIIFDFVFNCLLFIFITNKFLKNAKN